ncbi:MAG: polysaccharide pyruvyl transferase family protein [Pseudomonadota bacterium]
MIIAVENSTWSNIGDAFYQQSIEEVFRRTFPDSQVFAFDGPAERAFRAGNWIKNSTDLRPHTVADHFVFSGPILSDTFLKRYGQLIKNIKDARKSYSLISVHGGADPAALAPTFEFLNRYRPCALHTRDQFTFERFSGVSDYRHSGLCFAFFAKHIENLPALKPDIPYICSSFYSIPEPKFEVRANSKLEVEGLRFTQFKRNILPWRAARHLQFAAPHIERQSGFDIIRPVHDAYRFPNVSFGRRKAYLSYNPKCFLSVYKYASATISDRVHAGVVSLSFGKPALIKPRDARYELFDNPAITKTDGLLRADQKEIDRQYDLHIDWLRNIPFGK